MSFIGMGWIGALIFVIGASMGALKAAYSTGVYKVVLFEASNTRNKSKFIAASAIVLGTVGACLTGYGLVIRTEAETLLKDLTALRVGRETEADVQQFSRRHRWFLVSNGCNNGVCTTTFRVRNSWLSVLRLEPDAEFDADFDVRDGTVTRTDARLGRSMPIYPTFPGSAGFVSEYAKFPAYLAERQGHYLFSTPVGKPYLKVEIDSETSAVQRERAFAFSFRCLVKPGWGCNLPCDYLPLAWQDWKAEVQTSGFPMGDFDRTYPNNARCTH
jgi:hypothetical protein